MLVGVNCTVVAIRPSETSGLPLAGAWPTFTPKVRWVMETMSPARIASEAQPPSSGAASRTVMRLRFLDGFNFHDTCLRLWFWFR